MRLCQLIASYERTTSPFHGLDPYPDASRWLPEHDWTTCLVDKATAAATIDLLVARGFDAFVNLCDGEPEEDIAGVEVSERLAGHGVAYTGADPRCFRLGSSRAYLKATCRALGIATPAHVFLDGPDPLGRLAEVTTTLRFPIFVKPPNGYASIGIEPTSRVDDRAGLVKECARVHARFGGALIEEYVDGPELTVLVVEPAPGEPAPIVYPAMEVVFPAGERFKHFGLKWMDYEQMTLAPVLDPALDARVRALVGRFFAAMDGVGYCRCDLRMDAAGRLFLLDCNTTPGVCYPPGAYGCADHILDQEPGGHRRFLDHLLACAGHRAGVRGRRAL